MGNAKLFQGDCLETLKLLEADSVDTVITDPPAAISLFGKEWDSDKGGRDKWVSWLSSVMKECFRVMKPGGSLLVWAFPRRAHWTALAIEDAGFEIRDKLYHHYASGFPKGIDISKAIDKAAGAERKVVGTKRLTGNACVPCKDKGGTYGVAAGTVAPKEIPVTAPATEAAKLWDGWKTGIKPATEEWILAQKPLEGGFAANALKHGVAGLNIGGCRVGGPVPPTGSGPSFVYGWDERGTKWSGSPGRWPANAVFSHTSKCTSKECDESCPVAILRNQCEEAPRFFYTPKSSTREREEGLLGKIPCTVCGGLDSEKHTQKGHTVPCRRNDHPTVKPLKLMRWLCKLTATPTGGVVLDPFMGSGTTGVAALLEGRSFIGIEQDEHSYEIAKHRIAFAESEAVVIGDSLL